MNKMRSIYWLIIISPTTTHIRFQKGDWARKTRHQVNFLWMSEKYNLIFAFWSIPARWPLLVVRYIGKLSNDDPAGICILFYILFLKCYEYHFEFEDREQFCALWDPTSVTQEYFLHVFFWIDLQVAYIPHICHLHHLQCRCQNFQAGVKKFLK